MASAHAGEVGASPSCHGCHEGSDQVGVALTDRVVRHRLRPAGPAPSVPGPSARGKAASRTGSGERATRGLLVAGWKSDPFHSFAQAEFHDLATRVQW